jgi:hypothetical protein
VSTTRDEGEDEAMSEGYPAVEGDASRRIGDQERAAAVTALIAHREARRLDPEEYEDRQVRVARARTWAEIQPLFDDLPEPHPVGMPAAAAGFRPLAQPGGGTVAVPPGAAIGQVTGQSSGPLGRLVPDRHKATVMALTPFAAVVLFFATPGGGPKWLWFLAIPIMGILLYGAEGNDERKRRERDERRARRREGR